jgi:steroid 5-alpha reductase family enzyme
MNRKGVMPMLKAFMVTLICLILVFGILLGTTPNSQVVFGMPVIALCAALCFIVQWLIYIPSYLKQTERFYDLTGSLTFISVILFALFSAQSISPYAIFMATMVIIWALRLGIFLFIRIGQDGKDDRFIYIKSDKYRFYIAWTIQGLWVFLTSLAALVAITSSYTLEISPLTVVGMMIWLVGFFVEVTADYQKRQFKHKNPDTFISIGLWAYSRHPNYFGEIMLWTGVAIATLPALHGWQHLALISPIFVAILLITISGIPMLEDKAESKWGDNADYIAYKNRTSILVPFKRSSN